MSRIKDGFRTFLVPSKYFETMGLTYIGPIDGHDIEKMTKVFREANTYYVDTYDEFKEKIEKWFIFAHWDGTAETAEKIQEETKATIRCIPNEWFVKQNDEWVDMISWKPSAWRVLFAKSY